MNPLLPGGSGTSPEPSRNALNVSQATNEDDTQNDPHPKASLFHGQMTQNSGPGQGHYMVTGVNEQTRNGRDMVTGVTEDLRNRHDMVTGATEQIGNCHNMIGVHEEVTYWPLIHLQGSRRRTVLTVNHNSAVKTHLRRSKQTKFCWAFSSWQIVTILRTFTIISTEFPNYQSH